MDENFVDLILTRDSVCMQDDMDPPHTEIIQFDPSQTTRRLVKILASSYLPKIGGYGHSWDIYLNDELIAATSFFRTKILVDKVIFSDQNRVNCVYHSANW